MPYAGQRPQEMWGHMQHALPAPVPRNFHRILDLTEQNIWGINLVNSCRSTTEKNSQTINLVIASAATRYIYIYTHTQGVTLRLKPYDCLKCFDVTLKLKQVSVLLPLELVSVFSRGRVLEVHIFGDFRPKRSILGHFLGGWVCQNLHVHRNPFIAGEPPRNPGQSATL